MGNKGQLRWKHPTPCAKCGYLLQNLPVDVVKGAVTCPECGFEYHPGLRERRGDRGVWITMLVLGFLLPFAGLVTAGSLVQSVQQLRAVVVVVAVLVFGLAFAALHVRRPGVPGQRHHLRHLVIAIVLTAAMHAPPALLIWIGILLYNAKAL